MILALYRRPGERADLRLELPGSELDFARIDAAAVAKWGTAIRRIASWLS